MMQLLLYGEASFHSYRSNLSILSSTYILSGRHNLQDLNVLFDIYPNRFDGCTISIDGGIHGHSVLANDDSVSLHLLYGLDVGSPSKTGENEQHLAHRGLRFCACAVHDRFTFRSGVIQCPT